jgi:hypothetical protein
VGAATAAAAALVADPKRPANMEKPIVIENMSSESASASAAPAAVK